MTKIKDIRGAIVPEKQPIEVDDYGGWGNSGDVFSHGYDVGHAEGFNEAITQQGEVDLTLNREKSIKELLRVFNLAIDEFQKGYIDGSELCQAQYEALISSLDTILEVKK